MTRNSSARELLPSPNKWFRHFLLPREKTITRKLAEIFLALQFETMTDKKKILELYVNSLFMGHGAYGVAAAAQRFFGKPLKQLKLHEHALIAGLFQSPSALNPHRHPKRARKRQRLVLQSMYKAGYLTKDQRNHWGRQKLVYQSYESLYGSIAPYFVDFVHQEAKRILAVDNVKGRGLRIETTLDPTLQTLAETTLTDGRDLFERAERRILPLPRDGGGPFKGAS